ncbi:MAG: PqqD family protein [Proteobacteria bacterium]|mgnify:CR=1 FL=1|jgi:hypothetical protein|nr:PqqD family protein [Pseudomonadota bacterium]
MEALQQLAISPTGFIFDPRSGATFSVNPTARMLLEGIRDGLGLAELEQQLVSEFHSPAADLRRDILEFTHILRDEGLLSSTFELEP